MGEEGEEYRIQNTGVRIPNFQGICDLFRNSRFEGDLRRKEPTIFAIARTLEF